MTGAHPIPESPRRSPAVHPSEDSRHAIEMHPSQDAQHAAEMDPPEDSRAPPAVHLSEDPEREPDGVPHEVIGLTVLLSVGLAIAFGGYFLTDSTIVRVLMVVLGIASIALMVVKLTSVAERDRDHEHPSR